MLKLKSYAHQVVTAAALGCSVAAAGLPATGQVPAPAAAPAPARQMGTVKAASGSNLTIVTDAAQQIAVTVADNARIVQLAPGSTDLKSAQAITLTDIGPGDRVLVTGKAGDDAGSFSATRVILMKSGDIAQKHASEQADWQRRGMGGIVSAVDPATGVLTLSSGAKKTQVTTQAKTIFRRYAGDSIKFEDAKPGTIAQIRVGDQLEVRGTKAEDGSSVEAEEVVSGSFRNLSGTLTAINTAAGTISLKDLTTKKVVNVTVTANSDLRKLPPEVAARFAAREKGTTAGGTGVPGAGGAGQPAAGRPAAAAGDAPPGAPPAGAGGMGRGPGSGGRSVGMDLSKMLARLPNATLADMHVGDAVMIVASQAQPGSDSAMAVTLLAGVEAILAAAPAGSEAMTLSPWSVGGDAPGGGGGGQ